MPGVGLRAILPGFLLALWQPAGPLPIGYPSCPRECQLLEASITRKPTPIKCSGDSTLFGCKFRFLAPGKRRNRRNGFRRNDFTGFAKIGHYFRVRHPANRTSEWPSQLGITIHADSCLHLRRRETSLAVVETPLENSDVEFVPNHVQWLVEIAVLAIPRPVPSHFS